jgi:hypothetical protein
MKLLSYHNIIKLLTGIAVCLAGIPSAYTQLNIVKAEYFIDSDPGFGLANNISLTAAANIADKQTNISLTGVSDGIHYLFLRSKDANGNWSVTNKLAFYKTNIAGNPLVNVIKAEYFIDTDPGFGNAIDVPLTGATNIADKTALIALGAVPDGIHNLFVRSRDANGKWSITNKLAFFKTNTNSASLPNINKAEFFIDTDPGFGKATDIPVSAASNILDKTAIVPLGAVTDGIHNLYVRSRDVNGKWSISNKLPFYKTTAAQGNLPNVVKAEYFIDADPGFDKAINIPVTAAPDIADKSSLISLSNVSNGFHFLLIRSKDVNGRWSVTNKLAFFKTKAVGEPLPNIVACEYFFDTDPGFGKGVPVAVNPSTNIPDYVSLVNITNLTAGTHQLFIRSKDVNGNWSITNVIPVPITTLAASPYITVNSITAKNLCGSQQFNLSFDASGTYNNGNVFTVQLSDAAGSFAAPLAIGNITATKSSIIKCTIPLHITNGNGYKVKVVSNNPVVNGVVSDTVFSLLDQPKYNDTSVIVVCQNDNFNLLNIYNTSAYTLAWSTNTPASAPIGTHQMYTSNTSRCKDTAVIIVKQDVATWTGATSKNWHTITNWSTGKLPSTKTHVIIPNGTPNICEVSEADITIPSIQVKPGGIMNVINSRKVNITAQCSPLPPG